MGREGAQEGRKGLENEGEGEGGGKKRKEREGGGSKKREEGESCCLTMEISADWQFVLNNK